MFFSKVLHAAQINFKNLSGVGLSKSVALLKYCVLVTILTLTLYASEEKKDKFSIMTPDQAHRVMRDVIPTLTAPQAAEYLSACRDSIAREKNKLLASITDEALNSLHIAWADAAAWLSDASIMPKDWNAYVVEKRICTQNFIRLLDETLAILSHLKFAPRL
jgi:hypothetical protein